jgi:hypothetical protein
MNKNAERGSEIRYLTKRGEGRIMQLREIEIGSPHYPPWKIQKFIHKFLFTYG